MGRCGGTRSPPALPARITIRAADGIGGIATSGARGRSFSLGIADAVTVVAASAAAADAAAAIVANAVDAHHPGIVRQPACVLDPDSDLRDLQVTVSVPRLPAGLVDEALRRGLARAAALRRAGLIIDAALSLQGRHLVLGGAFRLVPPPAREGRTLATAGAAP